LDDLQNKSIFYFFLKIVKLLTKKIQETVPCSASCGKLSLMRGMNMSAAAGRSQNTVRQDESPHEHRLLDGSLARQPVCRLIKFMLVKRDPVADIVTQFFLHCDP